MYILPDKPGCRSFIHHWGKQVLQRNHIFMLTYGKYLGLLIWMDHRCREGQISRVAFWQVWMFFQCAPLVFADHTRADLLRLENLVTISMPSGSSGDQPRISLFYCTGFELLLMEFHVRQAFTHIQSLKLARRVGELSEFCQLSFLIP